MAIQTTCTAPGKARGTPLSRGSTCRLTPMMNRPSQPASCVCPWTYTMAGQMLEIGRSNPRWDAMYDAEEKPIYNADRRAVWMKPMGKGR